MNPIGPNSRLALAAALAMLALRALTPEGYMPGSPASGLLFELCPSGVPAGLMQALSGELGHHHHGADGEAAQGTEQCPIGHMLSSAVATDLAGFYGLVPVSAEFPDVAIVLPGSARLAIYRSRAPPA